MAHVSYSTPYTSLTLGPFPFGVFALVLVLVRGFGLGFGLALGIFAAYLIVFDVRRFPFFHGDLW